MSTPATFSTDGARRIVDAVRVVEGSTRIDQFDLKTQQSLLETGLGVSSGSTIVSVVNNTGAALQPFSAVSIKRNAVHPSFDQSPNTFASEYQFEVEKGVEGEGVPAVLLGSINAGLSGQAVIAGLAMVLINGDGENIDFCDFHEAGSTEFYTFKPTTSGRIELLWQQAAAGVPSPALRYGIVLLGSSAHTSGLVPFMVSCYLGNGWYEVYKLDMDPPDLPANQVIDETTGQTRIVQPWAGHTTWQLLDLIAPSGNWQNIDSDGEGTSQTPDAQNYPGIQISDTVVTDNELTAGQNYGLCIPECYASQCTWEWQTDNWIKVAQADCETEQGGDDPNSPGSYVHGGCSCQMPAIPDPVPENGTQVVTACAASDCSSETPPDATWEWQQVAPATHFGDFTPYWKLVDDCGNPDPTPDGRCRAVPPNTDGTFDGETITVQCYPSGLCSYVTEMNDPIDLCCDELIADPDYVPRQEGHRTDAQQVSPDTYGDPVKAFSIDKMTQPGSFDLTAAPGTYGFMLPFKSGQFDPDINEETNWGIVQWQRTLIKASIPTAIQCCPTSGGGTEIKITAWTDMIVEGLYCGGQSDPCEV